MRKKLSGQSAISSSKRALGKRGHSSRTAGRTFERLEDRRLLSAATLLNEIDINPPGTQDNRYEYVEIEGTPGASLNNDWFVAMDPGGVPEMVLNLSGFSIGTDGLAVIKASGAGFAIPAATTLIPDNTFFTQTGGFAQTPITFLLFSSPNAFSATADYDQNNDGVLDHLPTGATLLDSVANEKGSALVYSPAVIFDDNGDTPDAVTRFFGSTGNTTASWFGGELNDTNNVDSTKVYDSTRPGTNMPLNPLPSLTPGTLNYPVPAGPTLTPSGNTATFSGGSTPVAIDPGITISDPESTTIQSATITTTGMSEDQYAFNLPPTMSYTITQGQNGQQSVKVIALSGLDSVADYQAALESITYRDTAGGSATQGTRTLSFTINDGIGSASTTENVNVAIAAPSVSPSGNIAQFTAGGPAVAIDGGLALSSADTNLTGASVKISSATLQSGDTLNFISPAGSGITGTFSPNTGSLTLTGAATVAQYQAALQSVTFANATSTSTASRGISITAQDGALVSNTASETVDVAAPLTVSGVYVSGSAWNPIFLGYLAGHGLGSASYGFALPTGSSAAQLATLPWNSLNTITVTFSGTPSQISASSLELVSGSTNTVLSTAGTLFTSLGNNTYQWVLPTALGNGQDLISIASTNSSFGTPVNDAQGAGLSGSFNTGQAFPSGSGLAGGTFNFFFNVLPGDVNRDKQDNGTDVSLIRPLSSGTRDTSTAYSPFDDVNGDGQINTTDLSLVRPDSGRLATGSPTAPSAAPVGGLAAEDVASTGLALGAVETTATSSSTSTAVVANIIPASAPSNAPDSGSSSSDLSTGSSSDQATVSSGTLTVSVQATDEALAALEGADWLV